MSDEIKLEDDIVSQDDDGQNNSQISDDNNLEEQIKKLKEENHKIQLELNKFKQIAMSAQSQYVSLKYEFESLISRFDNEKKTLETKSFLDNIKKIIPFIEELRKTVELLPHDLSEHNWVKWVQIVYGNMIIQLWSIWISYKNWIWHEPDPRYFEAIWTENSEDNKWKIIKEFERCYVYKKGDEDLVVNVWKVIVGI